MSLPSADATSARFGRYRLLERLGAGGMAIVYRASAVGPDGKERELVIKRVLPELSRDKEFSAMLVAEARISARLRHPNIVQVYELGRVDDEYYLAMELVDGVDVVKLLNRCIERKRPVPIGLACHIAAEVASALGYAHDLADNEGRPLAIVHRDVSPSNVMISRTGAVKLLDFGVAKAAEHVRDERTRTGTLKGKVNYLSPESADGLPVDRRADVFALGIVLHEVLTLRRLFKTEGDLQTLRLIREAKVALPSTQRLDVPPELDRIVMKMLARNPSDRYPDCKLLAAELQPLAQQAGAGTAALAQFLEELGPGQAAPAPSPAEDMDSGPTPAMSIEVLSEPHPITARTAKAPRRRWLVPTLAGAAAFLAIGIAILVGRRTPSPPPPLLAVAPTPAPEPPAAKPPAPAPGLLVIGTNVTAAHIELDGKPVADQVARARVPVAQPGAHELMVSAPRRRPFKQTVTIAAGATVELTVKLEKSYSTRSKPVRGENYLVDPFGKKP
jgi:serine/threonine-protein kinase